VCMFVYSFNKHLFKNIWWVRHCFHGLGSLMNQRKISDFLEWNGSCIFLSSQVLH
jgi:hypothetical protein